MDHVRRPGFHGRGRERRRSWRHIKTGRTPYAAVSDFERPYAAMPQMAPVPRYGPMLLPPQEVYRDRPRQRVFAARDSAAARLVYTIAVIDRGGDGRAAGDRCAQRADPAFSCRPI